MYETEYVPVFGQNAAENTQAGASSDQTLGPSKSRWTYVLLSPSPGVLVSGKLTQPPYRSLGHGVPRSPVMEIMVFAILSALGLARYWSGNISNLVSIRLFVTE